MELHSNLTGTILKDFTLTLNWRETMNYAAAINDCNNFYFDDERKGGIIAPPMYSVAITWNILGKIWEFIDTDKFPMEIIATQVHFTEYLEFHRPAIPGDTLTIIGKIAAILPHRSGTYVVIHFDAIDKKGQPVFTEQIGALMRGVTCGGNGQGEENLPKIPEHSKSELLWEESLHIPPLQPYIYDGCTDIFFPIHTSPQFAKQVGLPGIILQGTATLAFAIREIINREAGGNPERLKRLYCKFSGMVLPGTDITIQNIGKSDTVHTENHFFEVLNTKGERAVKGGFAEIKKTEE